MTHALFAPSVMHRRIPCAGSVALESVCKNESNDYADEGTATHALGAWALKGGDPAAHPVGYKVIVSEPPEPIREVEVDQEMLDAVAEYVAFCRALGGVAFVEQEISIEHLTREPDATGTADFCALLPRKLIVVDLKYGRGVRVDAHNNPQLKAYASGALKALDPLGDVVEVEGVIFQPRLGHVSRETWTLAELDAFQIETLHAAERGYKALTYFQKYGEVHEKYLNPGDDQCRFCNAKAICPALAEKVIREVEGDFLSADEQALIDGKPLSAEETAHAFNTALTPPTWAINPAGVTSPAVSPEKLARYMGAIDLIEAWCKAVRARVESELLAGNVVPGYKLVSGRKGARKWADENEAEAKLKAMRLTVETMYDLKLISPTTAEKLSKAGKIGSRQWKALQALITQSPGSPSVAIASDPRPALTRQNAIEDFSDEAPLV